jgi:pimeloyl-ACP methyl ester carboxylesterase
LQDFDCIIPDLPAFGESEPLLLPHTIEHYADWLGAFIETLKLKNDTTLLAHSFGTIVLGCLAARGLNTRVVLVNPVSAPALTGPKVFLTKLTTFYYRLAGLLGEKLGRRLLALKPIVWQVTEQMFIGKNIELKRWVDLQHQTYFSRFSSVEAAVEGFDASIAHDLTDYASDIKTDVLLICADRDEITPIVEQRQAAELYQNATYVELVGVGHLTHYQRPEEIARHTREFIAASR